MQVFDHPLGIIKVPGQEDSLDDLYRLRQTEKTWAADTEATSLGIYLPGYQLRLVQVGTEDEAWVLRPGWHDQAIHDLTKAATWHNLPFDALTLEVTMGIDYHDTAKDADDSSLWSRLLDPRGKDKGGLGHKLEDLVDAYIMKQGGKKDSRAALVEAGRKYKIKAADIFRDIPIDDPAYLYYAGQDVLQTARVADYLRQKVNERQLQRFYIFETVLQNTVVEMQRQGTLIDKKWTVENRDYFLDKMAKSETHLTEYWGIEQSDTSAYVHTSTKNLQKRFEDMGVTWAKFSEKTQKPSLDREVLQTFAKNNDDIGQLARDILETKRAKHYADYLISVMDYAGIDGRIHPNISPLRAATARMSISQPAIQQWPSFDPDASYRIRGSLIADYGHVIVSADYRQVEFRVAAAVSGDSDMKAAIIAGEDLHARTATILYGPDFTKHQRDSVKPAGFGRLFLGGAKTIHMQAEMMGLEIPMVLIKKSIRAFDRAWPQTIAWGKQVIARAEDNPMIHTATGRPLIVGRPYAAVNYLIQSPARDIFASGILRLHDAGLGHYLRLVVHDEVVLSVPEDQAEEIVPAVQEAMETTFKGVPILTDASIKGKHWSK